MLSISFIVAGLGVGFGVGSGVGAGVGLGVGAGVGLGVSDLLLGLALAQLRDPVLEQGLDLVLVQVQNSDYEHALLSDSALEQA